MAPGFRIQHLTLQHVFQERLRPGVARAADSVEGLLANLGIAIGASDGNQEVERRRLPVRRQAADRLPAQRFAGL
jgi:hypothetical protein